MAISFTFLLLGNLLTNQQPFNKWWYYGTVNWNYHIRRVTRGVTIIMTEWFFRELNEWTITKWLNSLNFLTQIIMNNRKNFFFLGPVHRVKMNEIAKKRKWFVFAFVPICSKSYHFLLTAEHSFEFYKKKVYVISWLRTALNGTLQRWIKLQIRAEKSPRM